MDAVRLESRSPGGSSVPGCRPLWGRTAGDPLGFLRAPDLSDPRGGVRVLLDTSGELLRRGGGGGTYLVKPNAEELADLMGTPVTSPEEAARRAGPATERRGGRGCIARGARRGVGPWHGPAVCGTPIHGCGEHGWIGRLHGVNCRGTRARQHGDGGHVTPGCGGRHRQRSGVGTGLCTRAEIERLAPQVKIASLQLARRVGKPGAAPGGRSPGTCLPVPPDRRALQRRPDGIGTIGRTGLDGDDARTEVGERRKDPGNLGAQALAGMPQFQTSLRLRLERARRFGVLLLNEAVAGCIGARAHRFRPAEELRGLRWHVGGRRGVARAERARALSWPTCAPRSARKKLPGATIAIAHQVSDLSCERRGLSRPLLRILFLGLDAWPPAPASLPRGMGGEETRSRSPRA